MRSWPIQNKEDLDKTKGTLTEWVEIMFLGTFLLISVALLDFLKLLSFYEDKKSTIKVIIACVQLVNISRLIIHISATYNYLKI